MTLTQFLNEFTYSPLNLYDIAELASQIEDAPALSDAANNYIKNTEILLEELEKIGYLQI